MKRIIIHWTAGTYQPNSAEFEHYHYLVNRDGLVIKGKHNEFRDIYKKQRSYSKINTFNQFFELYEVFPIYKIA